MAKFISLTGLQKVAEIVKGHMNNTTAHVTSSERTKWNAKADSSAIPTDEHINNLIDTKLGVIENGSY